MTTRTPDQAIKDHIDAFYEKLSFKCHLEQARHEWNSTDPDEDYGQNLFNEIYHIMYEVAYVKEDLTLVLHEGSTQDEVNAGLNHFSALYPDHDEFILRVFQMYRDIGEQMWATVPDEFFEDD